MLPGNSHDVFLETDVAFDIISKREPFFATSVQILQSAAGGKVRLFISEASLANLIYLSIDIYKLQDAVVRLIRFIEACELVPCGKVNALKAMNSPFKDKEDAVQYFSAVQAKTEYLVTRNIKDYKYSDSSVTVVPPELFLKIIC